MKNNPDLTWEHRKWKVKYKLRKFFYTFLLPYFYIRNYILVKRFPFLEPQCGWSVDMLYWPKGYKYHYEETWLDGLPKGWRKKFGLDICRDLQKVIEEDHITDFKVHQVKEKFGGLCWYYEGGNKRIHEVIQKYENLSYEICINCGKEAEYVERAWIGYFCEQHAKKIAKNKGMTLEQAFSKIENKKRSS